MSKGFDQIREHAAGIDLGATEHFVAVPPGSSPCGNNVKSFPGHTLGLKEMAAWLKECNVQTVAMESTGVYWVPVYDILEQVGFDVNLVHAAHVKALPGRKSDVLDCQWLQKLHACGLVSKCFRPKIEIIELRSLARWREGLIKEINRVTLHMQKSFDQMNVLVHRAVTDMTGKTGIAIIEAILKGERNPEKLANLRDGRCKKTEGEMVANLSGNFRNDYLFQLRQAYDTFKFKKSQLQDLDIEIEKKLRDMEPPEVPKEPLPKKRGRKKPQGNEPNFNLRSYLYEITGVDLTQVEGMQALTVLKIISEVGVDLKKNWKTSKKFVSWLAICPGTRITGGKSKSGQSRNSANRAAAAFRMAAQSLCRSKGPLGALYRSFKRRLDGPQVITAIAHKLARIFYTIMTTKRPYNPEIHKENQEKQEVRMLRGLMKKANALGFVLVSEEEAKMTLNELNFVA